MKVNLYIVHVGDHEWCYFVFAGSANRARSICVHHFAEEEYIDLRAYLLNKDVGGQTDVVVDCPEDDGYDRVTALGRRYMSEEESEERK